MLNISPKQLTYISIFLAIIVILGTIGVLLFPKSITRCDQFLSFKGKASGGKNNLAFFINYAITPITVVLFYGIVAIILLLTKQGRILGIGVSSILMSTIAFWSLKRITQRPRPKSAKLQFKDYSFPSGHTTAGFVFFLSLALALARILGIYPYEGLFLLALIGGGIIGRSRWYLQVHWLSDILIGAVLGCGCFLFSYLLFFYFGDAIFNAIEQVFFSL
ncbi:MAG: hypothetical protein DLD55_00590 [candidate division SR1 bacterium]|nr:MAG: hypothetical protein DLD55_00590 [candidate division SR1 bacterium]